jgi:hypothetical protein
LGAAGSCHVRGYDDSMTDSQSRRSASRWFGAGFLVAVVVAACNPGLPPSPSNSAAAPTTSGEPSTAPSNTDAGEIGQTDTDWGRIWDGVPEAFPIYPGATHADDVATELVSATFVLADGDPRAVAAWMQTELERATFATEALNGPMEDGSYVLESTGSSGCRIQVSIAPAGGLTSLGVRYGADCPSP